VKSVCLTPYCPWPADTGTKMEMMKHLNVLKGLGKCTIASARRKPVGFGWTSETETAMQDQGFELIFREASESFRPVWLIGFAYAALCQGMELDRSFGHSNPYHRYAFSQHWWRRVTAKADLAVIQYGFWGRLRSHCPQAIVVQELLSSYHWEGNDREIQDWKHAALLCVVGHDEQEILGRKMLNRVLWSPPAIKPENLPLSDDIGLIGTKAPQNLEGLRWLEQARGVDGVYIKVFGNLASEVRAPFLKPVGRYGANTEPYERCGIHLMTRSDRPGLQIKVVEALAYGRVIVARRGSMRGLPSGEKAWIDVETPEEMLAAAMRFRKDRSLRERMAEKARAYYQQHLSYGQIISDLKDAYLQASQK
jgi:hypothetical protein